MKRYVFLSNGNKPNYENYTSRDPLKISNFSKPCLKAAHKMNYEVYLGVNRKEPEGIKTDMDFTVHLYDQHTYRNVLAFKDNFIAYKNLMKLLREKDFDVIHCNTPIGGVIGRFCGKRANINKVIYTAHGFHFYEGAPLLNRTLFKWAEMFMARWTDAIITMNKEDYEAAKKFKLKKGGKVFYTPGVGIDTAEYRNTRVDRKSLRASLGLKESDVVCISMGGLIPRKNYKTAIIAIAKCPKIHYLICGEGPEMKNLKKLANELKVEKRVHFLGYRSDIKQLLKASDIFLFTTLQEGLPRSMMEAMASGLPCVASKIRGNVDLIEDGVGGYLVSPKKPEEFVKPLNRLAHDTELRTRMGKANSVKILDFDVKVVEEVIENIYKEVLGDEL